jgi:hypothetical protein
MTQQREALNTLAVAVDASTTAWTFANALRFVDGSRLSVDLEDVYVNSVSSGGLNASVTRAAYGSTAAAHTTTATVHVNPSWTNWEIAQAVNDELHDLSSPHNGLFRIRSADFDYTPSTSGYNLAGLEDMLDVWRVRYQVPGPNDEWPVIGRKMWRIDHAADTTDFADGTQLYLREGGYPGHKVRVTYRAQFDTLTAVTDDVEAVSGLPATAHDILSLGAAIRLLSGLEAQRALSTTQADPRRAEEVQSGNAARAIVPLLEQREDRINAEARRLTAKYPRAM